MERATILAVRVNSWVIPVCCGRHTVWLLVAGARKTELWEHRHFSPHSYVTNDTAVTHLETRYELVLGNMQKSLHWHWYFQVFQSISRNVRVCVCVSVFLSVHGRKRHFTMD